MLKGRKQSILFLQAILVLSIVITACGKNDGIRTAGGGSYPVNPGGYDPYLPQDPGLSPFPNNPGGGGGFYPPTTGGGYGGGGWGGPGTFQPYFPSGYGTGFYPWMPIYGYYQQNVSLQPAFVVLWTGWENYACANQIPVYDFTAFWYNYCPQVMSTQLYQYFNQNFYPWMTPRTVLYTSVNPQVFWQNYIGRPY